MIKTFECPECGQLNNVDTQKFSQALCGSCKVKFSSEVALGVYESNNELAAALEINSDFSQTEKLDVDSWTSKIGGSEKKEKYVKREFLKKIKKHASKIPFAKDAVSMYFCAVDSKTPLTARLTAFGALAYIVLPFDLIPDVLIGVGYTDDAAAFWTAYKIISIHITDEHRKQSQEWFVK
ncbi:YkvA family protein [Paenibacillus sp. CMAA1364]